MQAAVGSSITVAYDWLQFISTKSRSAYPIPILNPFCNQAFTNSQTHRNLMQDQLRGITSPNNTLG